MPAEGRQQLANKLASQGTFAVLLAFQPLPYVASASNQEQLADVCKRSYIEGASAFCRVGAVGDTNHGALRELMGPHPHQFFVEPLPSWQGLGSFARTHPAKSMTHVQIRDGSVFAKNKECSAEAEIRCGGDYLRPMPLAELT